MILRSYIIIMIGKSFWEQKSNFLSIFFKKKFKIFEKKIQNFSFEKIWISVLLPWYDILFLKNNFKKSKKICRILMRPFKFLVKKIRFSAQIRFLELTFWTSFFRKKKEKFVRFLMTFLFLEKQIFFLKSDSKFFPTKKTLSSIWGA